MKNKYFYPIFKLKIKSWIKYWLIKKTEFKGKLSEILEGFYFTLNNTLAMKFNLFEIYGNSIQDGTPSPDNEVPILSSGDNGSINEKIQTRNLFKNLPNTLDNYSIVMNNDGKKITFKGTNSSSIFYPSFIFYADGSVATSQWHPTKQQIDKSKGYFTKTGIAYILSLLKSGTFSGSNPSFFIGKETRFTSSGIFANVDTYTTQIANNSEKVNFIAIGFTPSQQVDLTFKIQLEPGTTATPYVEHKEQTYSMPVQQPMRSIGDVRDCFVKVNGNWYERHYIKEFIVSQNTSISLQSINDYGIANFYMVFQNNYYDLTSKDNQLCNLFSKQTSSIATTETEGFLPTMNLAAGLIGVYIRILSSRAKTVEEFKQWANTNNLKNYYILTEPLDLPCTEEQIEALENLPSTYKDYTIIQSEDETPAYLKIQYYKEG